MNIYIYIYIYIYKRCASNSRPCFPNVTLRKISRRSEKEEAFTIHKGEGFIGYACGINLNDCLILGQQGRGEVAFDEYMTR